MTTSRLLLMAVLATFCAASNAADPKAWDVVLSESQQVLDEDGQFVNSDEHFHYFGFLLAHGDPITAELEFLLAFQDGVSELLDKLCRRNKRSLSSEYRFNFPFTKNVVSQDGGDVFVAIVQAQTLRREAFRACAP
jgi:hypothetical protein